MWEIVIVFLTDVTVNKTTRNVGLLLIIDPNPSQNLKFLDYM